MFGVGSLCAIYNINAKNKKEKELSQLVLDWWDEHKDDMYIDSLDSDCNYKLYEEEPEFVAKARELING